MQILQSKIILALQNKANAMYSANKYIHKKIYEILNNNKFIKAFA